MADMMSASRDCRTNVDVLNNVKVGSKFANWRSLMNTTALNAQSPRPTATAESNNVAAQRHAKLQR